MKFSIVIPVPETSRLSDLEENVEMASELGYEGVELNIRDPTQIDQNELMEIVSVRGLEVSSILTGRVFTVDGLSLTNPDRRIRDLAIRRIESHISFAGASSAMVLIGWIRGNWGGHRERGQARKVFIDSLRVCAEFGEDRGVLLGIEPINRYEIDCIHTVDEAVTVIEKSSIANVGIVPDTFHMNIEENEPIYKSIRRCQNYLFHVHIADNNRKTPGMGHLPFKEFFKSLKEMNYDKFISVEVVPCWPDFRTVAEKSMEYMRALV